MKTNKFKIVTGLVALVLLIALTVQLIKVPTFMLPSVYLTGMFIVASLVGSLILGGIIKAIFKKTTFFTVVCSIVSISSLIFMYKFYSPTLSIVVPKGYVGQINLVLSNVNEDILNVDSNGIGYITKRTFDKVYTKPNVHETDETDINEQRVGFNPSTFWGTGKASAISTSNDGANKEIQFLSFEIVPKDKQGQKQYYTVDLSKVVDKSKLFVK